MNSSTTSTPDVFLNVRRAYRLLNDYQQMVIDSVRYKGAQLDIQEWGSEPIFAGDASRGYRYLWQPAWDWLPMMWGCFHFQKQLGDNYISLTFMALGDTGCFTNHVAPSDAGGPTFDLEDKSSTKFAFFLYGYPAHMIPITLKDRNLMKNFITTGTGLPEGVGGRCYDMSGIASEEDANQIVNDIVSLAKEMELPLERNNRP